MLISSLLHISSWFNFVQFVQIILQLQKGSKFWTVKIPIHLNNKQFVWQFAKAFGEALTAENMDDGVHLSNIQMVGLYSIQMAF